MAERGPGLISGWRGRLLRPAPAHLRWSLALGPILLFLILSQIVTGALLAAYYKPTSSDAYASVESITFDLRLGWLVRSLHLWGAHLIVGFMLLHLARTFAYGAYRKPREVTWLVGVLLLFAVLAAALTGQVLPQDEEGLAGALVATGMAKEIPGLGAIALGGERYGEATLGRFFAGHVIVIPFAMVLLVALHLSLAARHGLATREGEARAEGTSIAPLEIMSFGVLATLALLATLAVILPFGIGPKGSILSVSEGTKPPWYFLSAYQLLKFPPALYWPVLILAPLALLAVPFIDRSGRRTAIQALGMLAAIGAIALAMMGAYS